MQSDWRLKLVDIFTILPLRVKWNVLYKETLNLMKRKQWKGHSSLRCRYSRKPIRWPDTVRTFCNACGNRTYIPNDAVKTIVFHANKQASTTICWRASPSVWLEEQWPSDWDVSSCVGPGSSYCCLVKYCHKGAVHEWNCPGWQHLTAAIDKLTIAYLATTCRDFDLSWCQGQS
jgi:hypothetical protein